MKPPAPVIQIFSFSSGQYGSNEYWKQTKKKKQWTDRKGKWRGEKEGGKGREKKGEKFSVSSFCFPPHFFLCLFGYKLVCFDASLVLFLFVHCPLTFASFDTSSLE